MNISEYLNQVKQKFNSGDATEHSYRGLLEQLIESIVPEIKATNEPKRRACGAPDYILTKKDIPVGFIEAKDVGDIDLEGKKKNKEQFDRYKSSLNNLIFTDYLNFHLYQNGQFITKIAIAKLTDKGIEALPENFQTFENLIKDFCVHISQNIKSSKKLAEMMAGKARLLSDVIEKSLTSDEEKQENSTLKDQMLAFREILIHDITPKGFADVYAQTIAYGMFAARLHDATLPTFSRQEAAELIPKSNPFLRKLFGYIAGPDLDDRIKWIVDSLVEIFLACNVEELLKSYGKQTKTEDPIIHFYETFLSEYDPKLRKSRGVWYTPAPVVNFIVRAVDDVLKAEFNLPQGLADTSKTKIKVDIQGKKIEQEVHKVQILDPATGTGTFLAEVIKHIHQKFAGQQGIWSNYVETHLLPRLNGFELLMASYAMAHLQLDLLLTETGFKPTKNQRFKVYLTNSLEEHHQDTGTLFASWLSSEANEANHIKRDAPVMCVIGNPPYSGISSNNGKWISKLIDDYKYVDGVHFNERKHWLNDDYVKFLRYGQHFIEKNGSGILAFINPHGFLDNPTFRGMRWNLLKTYDKIYTIDLHGNAKKKETAPDGSADQNVFDIMQGVSINIFVKTGKKKAGELGKVFHFDLFGKREFKYDFLINNSLGSVDFKELSPVKPNLFFVPTNSDNLEQYNCGLKIDDLIQNHITGIMTAADGFVINEDKSQLIKNIKDFFETDYLENELSVKYGLGKNYAKWVIDNKPKTHFISSNIQKITHRPFDNKWTYYDNNFLWRSRNQIMKNYINHKNIGLITAKSNKSQRIDHFFISNYLTEAKTGESTTQSYNFPLYLYQETNLDPALGQEPQRTPNLNPEIVGQIENCLGLSFDFEGSSKLPLPRQATPATPSRSEGELSLATYNSTPSLLCNATASQGERELSLPATIPLHFSEGVASRSDDGVVVNLKTSSPKKLPYNQELRQRARELRRAGNLSEVLFWQQVKNRQIFDLDFDRQKIIGNYIVDFYCPLLGMVIEIDGISHDSKFAYDLARKHYLESFGLKVVNFSDLDVKKNLDGVISFLKNFILENYATTPSLLCNATPSQAKGNISAKNNSPSPREGVASRSDDGVVASNDLVVAQKNTFAPIDLLDYIYAILHSPKYREKYKEFLKIDFPRVPYPKDAETFWQLVKLGGEIRQIHLLESPIVENFITQYPIDGDNIVEKIKYQDGKVFINEAQYFAGVPAVAWEFYIGGYQPAQKWLKDRKGRKLEFDDILHYQKIIVALYETNRLMKEIDKINL